MSRKTATRSTPAASLEKMDETGRRSGDDRRQSGQTVASERRKKPRRRQIDPTTCEREYTQDEIDFMHALDEYKQRSGRMFPTCSEILEVLVGLGYRKSAAPAPLAASLPNPLPQNSSPV